MSKLKHAPYPDHPNRCQAIAGFGQCPHLAVPDQTNCQMHGGLASQKRKEKEMANQYRLQIWQQRLDEFSEHEDVKCLRGEIGILRLVLESIMVQCKNANDLLIHSARISDVATKIQNLAHTCDRLEKNMGTMMDRTAALSFASSIVEIISSEISDPETIDRISGKIIDLMSKK